MEEKGLQWKRPPFDQCYPSKTLQHVFNSKYIPVEKCDTVKMITYIN